MALSKSLYKTLFGGRGPRDGTLIDMAEHGRAGGVNTGTPFKHVQIAPLIFREASNSGDGTIIYYGLAKPGTVTSTASWRILEEDTSNKTILLADGDDNFDNIWDNRESLSYS